LLAETNAGASLNTFQEFGFELWAAGLATLPYSSFWLSWSELAQGLNHPPTSLGAMCVHMPAAKETQAAGLGIYVMCLVPRSRSGFKADRLVFSSQLIPMWLGQTTVRLSAPSLTLVGTESVRSAIRAVAALIGALGTPKALRSVEPAPERLNRQRHLKGRPEIRSHIVVDLRADKNYTSSEQGTHGGWTMKPHWRRGHVRTLADGRRVPIPPCCVNMEAGIPMKPEYVVHPS
jgi:hypothetical protein